MPWSASRIALGAVGAIIFLLGLSALTFGPATASSAIVLVFLGGVVLIAVALERTRYRSELAEHLSAPPGPGGGESRGEVLEPRFRRTEEAFVDPTTARPMRVFVDPRSGERRYVAED